MPTILYCWRKYAIAPSFTWPAISCMRVVPGCSLSIEREKCQAKARAAAEPAGMSQKSWECMEGRRNGRAEGRRNGRAEERRNGGTEGRRGGGTEGRRNGRAEGRRFGGTEGYTEFTEGAQRWGSRAGLCSVSPRWSLGSGLKRRRSFNAEARRRGGAQR